MARVGAVNLVDDDFGAAGGEPRVALNPAGGLGLGVGAAVVEHRAIGLGVKLLVLVYRHTRRCRRLDVDLGRTAGSIEYGWLLGFRCCWIGDDLCLSG